MARKTKRDIMAKLIAMDLGIEREIILAVINGFVDEIKNEVAEGNEVFFKGFGCFNASFRKSREYPTRIKGKIDKKRVDDRYRVVFHAVDGFHESVDKNLKDKY